MLQHEIDLPSGGSPPVVYVCLRSHQFAERSQMQIYHSLEVSTHFPTIYQCITIGIAGEENAQGWIQKVNFR